MVKSCYINVQIFDSDLIIIVFKTNFPSYVLVVVMIMEHYLKFFYTIGNTIPTFNNQLYPNYT